MANLYSGDIQANHAVGQEQTIRANSGETAFESKSLSVRTYSFMYTSPVDGGVCITRFYQNLTLLQVAGVTDSGTISVQLNKRSSPDTSGTNMLSSALGLSSTLSTTTSFANNSITADDWLYVDLSSKSGTINYMEITITFKLA